MLIVSSNTNLVFFRLKEMSEHMASPVIHMCFLSGISSPAWLMNVKANFMLSMLHPGSPPLAAALTTKLERINLSDRLVYTDALVGYDITYRCMGTQPNLEFRSHVRVVRRHLVNS